MAATDRSAHKKHIESLSEVFEKNFTKDDWEKIQDEFGFYKFEVLKSPRSFGLTLLLRGLAEKYAGVRKNFNREDAAILEHEELNINKKQVYDLRKWLGIPDMNPRGYYKIYNKDDGDFETHHWTEWLDLQPAKIKETFEQKITEWMEKYNLQKNFRDWLTAYIISGRRPAWKPLFNFELFYDICQNPSMAFRSGLTTQEKKLLKFTAKWFFIERRLRPGTDKDEAYILDKAGQPQETQHWTEKKGRAYYKEFIEYLKSVPNPKRRRSKRVFQDLSLLDIGGGVGYKDLAYRPSTPKKRADNPAQRQQSRRIKQKLNKMKTGI